MVTCKVTDLFEIHELFDSFQNMTTERNCHISQIVAKVKAFEENQFADD